MEVDDGVVVYDPATGRFADLNASAAELWVALEAAGWSASMVGQHLVRTYGMSPDEARDVVAAFLGELERTLPAGTAST
jgi:PqqD family protein of HPr-rel-A system